MEKNYRESQVLVIEVKKSKKMMDLRKLVVRDTFKNAMLHLWLKSVTGDSTICTEKAEEKVAHEALSKGQKLFFK